MYSKNIFAAGALLSVVAAVPMVKRDIVWVTETDEATVTVPVTTTIWVNPGESVPATSAAATTSTVSHFGHHRSHVTSPVHSTVTVSAVVSSETSVAPAPATTSSSVYVAPTIASTSVYVAPTTSTPVYVAPTTSTSVYIAPTTSTSVYVAPTTSTSVYVAPTTSSPAASITLSTYQAAVSTTAAATTAAAASGTTPSGVTYTGDITHYDVGEGSCGWTNSDSEAVVAIPHGMMNNGANPNNNPLCGQMITISYAGATTQAKIVDTCGGCDGAAIDLSPTLFTTVAPSGDGRVHGVEWWFDGSA
ncbi:hypothetical protein LTS02_006295 [Friedmanniomyces endolithicus]|nr:hypothetical protein LTS02_006295 [Friedmanniomyces endolithicus]